MKTETASNTKADFYLESHDSSNLEELLELIKTNYTAGDIVNKKYLNWQYHANPFGRPVMQVARHAVSKDLVGQYLVIPLEYVNNGEKVRGSLSLNTLTREDFRGRGLFTKLAFATYKACLQENISFTIGFPNPNSYPGFVNKLEFKNPGELTFLVKPTNYLGIVSDKIRNRKAERHGNDIPMGSFPPALLKNGFTVEEFSFSDDRERYVRFWECVCQHYSFTTNRSFEYIKWRYSDLPTRTYKIFKIQKNESIHGLFVIRCKETYGINTGVVVDFFCSREKDFQKYYQEALKQIMKYFRKKSIHLFLACVNPELYESEVLKSSGFFAPPKKLLPQQFPFIVRNHASVNSEVFEFSKAHLMFGDYDVI
jgi:hypothetical protein